MTVLDQRTKPVIEKGAIEGLDFTAWQRNYKSTLHKENYIPNTPLRVQIPVNTTVKQLRDQEYMYVYTTMNAEMRTRKQPKKITLFWDASLSMKERDIEKEITLLDAYLKDINSVTIHLVTFSNTLQEEKRYIIKNGDWKELRQDLENTTYDGGTDYSILASRPVNRGVVFLFTDGMYTLSALDLYSRVPVFTINSVVKSNHSALRKLANDTYGGYINLIRKDTKQALQILSEQPFKLLGYSTSNTDAEIYPKIGEVVINDFSMTARGFSIGDQITLQFGYDDTVTKEISIEVTDAFAKSDIIKRLWAKEKLEILSQNSKENKEAITNLGTEYQLVTDYTSLIVLDNVRDYVRYKITPPAELQEEYNRIIENRKKNRVTDIRRETGESEVTEDFIESSEMVNLKRPPIPEIIEVVEDEEIIEEMAVGVEISEDIVEIEELEIEENTTNSSRSAMYLGIINTRDTLNEAIEIDERALPNGVIPFAVIEQVPVYPGCEDVVSQKECVSEKISIFVRENFRDSTYIDEQELNPGVVRIFVRFVISEDGTVKNIQIRAPNQALEDEARRVIQLLPRMTPGKQAGKKISVVYSLPITIRIPDNGQTSPEPVVITPRYTKYKGKLIVKDRHVSTPYLKELREIRNVDKAYEYYLIQRTSYKEVPAYFIDVANFFKEKFNHQIYARRIVSNIPEIDGDNYELLKVFGYQMQLEESHDIAAFTFERILELRPEDSQSYRDLALAYENIGKCQEALDLLLSIVDGSIYKNNRRRIFNGVKTISEREIMHLVKEYKDDLKLDSIPTHYKKEDPMDIRVIVDWNHNDTDIDLHIIDPNLEECYYRHKKTEIGGKVSQDMTQGFGPEEYTVKKAIKGDYFVKVKYYGSRYQKIENPTFMKVTIFKKYGTLKETKETQLLRLVKADNEEIVAKLTF